MRTQTVYNKEIKSFEIRLFILQEWLKKAILFTIAFNQKRLRPDKEREIIECLMGYPV
jgi:hypothetical protein